MKRLTPIQNIHPGDVFEMAQGIHGEPVLYLKLRNNEYVCLTTYSFVGKLSHEDTSDWDKPKQFNVVGKIEIKGT